MEYTWSTTCTAGNFGSVRKYNLRLSIFLVFFWYGIYTGAFFRDISDNLAFSIIQQPRGPLLTGLKELL